MIDLPMTVCALITGLTLIISPALSCSRSPKADGTTSREQNEESIEKHWTEVVSSSSCISCEWVCHVYISSCSLQIERAAGSCCAKRMSCAARAGSQEERREKKNQVMAQHRPMQPCTRKFSPVDLFMHLYRPIEPKIVMFLQPWVCWFPS